MSLLRPHQIRPDGTDGAVVGDGSYAVQVADGQIVGLASASTSEGVAGELLMQDGVTSPPVPIETEAGDDWLYQG